MAKNAPKTGNSMRRGNAPSPYSKYRKIPYSDKRRIDAQLPKGARTRLLAFEGRG